MAIRDKIISGSNGINFTKETDSSADWPSIANSTYFRDVADGLIHYKNSAGTVLEIYGASGLTYFTEAQNTTAPNATVPVDSLTAITATTNGDVAIVPKGSGAFTLAVADSLVAGGHKRGQFATDLQTNRTFATQVASGNFSFIGAGRNNSATAEYSIAMGLTSIASGTYALAIGYNNTANAEGTVALGFQSSSTAICAVSIGQASSASGTDCVAIGKSNSASGVQTIAIGKSCTASSTGSVALGYSNTSSGNLSYTFGSSCLASNANAIAMGNRAKATGEAAICLASYFYQDSTASGGNSTLVGCGTVAGSFALGLGFLVTTGGAQATAIGYSSNTFSTIGRVAIGGVAGGTGEAQKGIIQYRQRTTDATPTILTTNNAVAFNDNAGSQLALQNQQVMRFKGSITAKQSGTTDIAVWDIDGVIVRGANIASTVLTVSNVNVVTNIPLWVTPILAANLSTSVGGLMITVTGVVATNIQWFAVLDTVENIYA